jgi:phosphomannomutase
MKSNFVFDVDGTLTPSRGKIDEGFEIWLTEWIKRNKVYLVTGSDYPKTVEQLGTTICESVQMCFNCAGNSRWQGGVEVYSDECKLDEDAWIWLESYLYSSRFPERAGLHLEERPGLVNFSIVGRKCNPGQRKRYVEWDTQTGEREAIAQAFNKKFKKYTATVAGETGLDIYIKGRDKGQIYDLLEGPVIFFGDKTMPGGNDFSLADRCNGEDDLVYPVSNWEDTANILQAYYG